MSYLELHPSVQYLIVPDRGGSIGPIPGPQDLCDGIVGGGGQFWDYLGGPGLPSSHCSYKYTDRPIQTP